MLQYKLLSTMTKVFADEEPRDESLPLSILKGEVGSFQVAVKMFGWAKLSVTAPGFKTRVREVRAMPSNRPCRPGLEDPDYLRKTPGLYPDLLEDLLPDGSARIGEIWKSFWVDVEAEENLVSGDYPVNVRIDVLSERFAPTEEFAELTQMVHVTDCVLPKQTLLHTNWFHSDCLADYYRVPALSEEHWQIIENFAKAARGMGVTMLLTPLFTPPLDTEIGTYRTTVQLIDVTVENGQYTFGFDKLKRWVDMCHRCGIEYFEMSHLYSQWQTNNPPQIVATVDGEYKRIFGWDDIATDAPYREFLACFLPQLVEKLKEWGIADYCRFHIKDEPHVTFRETYKAEKAQVEPYIPGFKIMDAMSHFDYVESGVIKCPVPIVDCAELDKFREACKGDYWLYYCCGPEDTYTNRFFAQPSYRTRILGTQLYVENAQGFLHWGYNFYNSERSRKHINPFCVTDGYEAFPSGDAFIVYPGEDQKPQESIRYMLMRQAMYDLRAMQLLESKIGREAVEAIINEDVDSKLTLANYPRTNAYLPTLRDKINREIEKFC